MPRSHAWPGEGAGRTGAPDPGERLASRLAGQGIDRSASPGLVVQFAALVPGSLCPDAPAFRHDLRRTLTGRIHLAPSWGRTGVMPSFPATRCAGAARSESQGRIRLGGARRISRVQKYKKYILPVSYPHFSEPLHPGRFCRGHRTPSSWTWAAARSGAALIRDRVEDKPEDGPGFSLALAPG